MICDSNKTEKLWSDLIKALESVYRLKSPQNQALLQSGLISLCLPAGLFCSLPAGDNHVFEGWVHTITR